MYNMYTVKSLFRCTLDQGLYVQGISHTFSLTKVYICLIAFQPRILVDLAKLFKMSRDKATDQLKGYAASHSVRAMQSSKSMHAFAICDIN